MRTICTFVAGVLLAFASAAPAAEYMTCDYSPAVSSGIWGATLTVKNSGNAWCNGWVKLTPIVGEIPWHHTKMQGPAGAYVHLRSRANHDGSVMITPGNIDERQAFLVLFPPADSDQRAGYCLRADVKGGIGPFIRDENPGDNTAMICVPAPAGPMQDPEPLFPQGFER